MRPPNEQPRKKAPHGAKLLLLGLLSCLWGCADTGSRGRPNVLLVTIDTLRADQVACYGNDEMKTPTMDDLAREGVLFEQALAPMPLTSPSHVSILTSQYPHRHGVLANCYTLDEQSSTLAEVLQSHGWRTAAIVSSITLAVPSYHRGFGEYQDRFIGGQIAGDIVAASTLNWLQAHAKEPFFLWLHFYDPHWPYEAPEQFQKLYPRYEPEEDSRNYVSAYQAEISFVDYLLEPIFLQLDQLRIRDETLIILTSDHGETLNEAVEQRNIDHAFDHAPLLYDTELRVPLIFTCPSLFDGGSRVKAPVSLLDLSPTILDLLGIEPPETFQGHSLKSLIEEPTRRWPGMTFSENGKHEAAPKLYCVRNAEWKLILPRPGDLIRYPLKFPQGDRTHTTPMAGELYDLTKDAQERHNLYEQEAQIVESLTRELREWQQGPGQTDRVIEEVIEPDTAAKLEALGYIL